MSDIDIYIDEKDTKAAKKIMTSLGYDYTGRLSYQHEFICNGISVELHFALWGYDLEKLKDFSSLFDQTYFVSDTSVCRLKPEFFYVFLIAHMAKHLKTSGIGVRAFLDIWVYIKKYGKDLDWNLIRQTLSEMALDRFEIQIRKLLKVWFLDEPWSETSELVTGYILSSYTHGTRKNEAASSLASSGKNKSQRAFGLVFPPLSYMRKRYFVLKKLPFLLPFFWIIRLICAPFSKNRTAKKDYNALYSVDDKDVQYAAEVLKAFGLSEKNSSLEINEKTEGFKTAEFRITFKEKFI